MGTHAASLRVKLLLDEHYSPQIAERLRRKGHDIIAVTAIGMAGIADEPLLAWAAGQQRVVMTNNVQDFLPIHGNWMAAGRSHHGIWLTDDRSMPRSKNTIGNFIEVIEARMKANPADDAFHGQVLWLP